MKVSELAEELEVPASTVLAQCQRFGIDATWAGAELGGADVVVLRAELASSAPIDLTPADAADEADEAGAASPPEAEAAPAEVASVPAAAAASGAEGAAEPAPSADLPPTAVGSMPEIVEEVTPAPDPESAAAAEAPKGPGFARTAAPATVADPNGARAARQNQTPTKPRFERTIRSAVIAIVVAVAAYVGSNYVDLAVAVVGLWLIAAIALVVAVIDSIRGRSHALAHPDRYTGAWVAMLTLVLAIGGIVGLTATVLSVTADDPEDAPLGLNDLSSVQIARWGYHRTMRLSENGWKQPARDEGSCWRADGKRKERSQDRVEDTKLNERDGCTHEHTLEVFKVFAFNRDADAPYPGEETILLVAQKQCAPTVERAQEKVPEATLAVEYPTQVGWGDGDHDIACGIATTEARTGKLAS